MGAVPNVQPRKLGSYEVLQEIGQGGMGVIYLARQPSLERFVVLKKIRRDLLADASIVDRFQLEARAAAAVQHQNVVAVYDCFSFRGDHFIAQEWVDGKDLRTILAEIGRLDPPIAALVALEIARGLEEIHARGIVHRDLKPANILIGRGGETKIADFGIALGGRGSGLTRPGMLLGSVPYMSPEQMLGQRVDHRSDVFSFGVMLYEMLTGSPPFRAADGEDLGQLLEAMQRQRFEPARREAAAVPGYLDRLIRACLEPKPPRRLASAVEARQKLERRLGGASPSESRRAIAEYLTRNGVLASPPDETAARPRPGRAERRSRLRTSGLVAAVAGGLVVVSAAAVHFRGVDAAADPAPGRTASPALSTTRAAADTALEIAYEHPVESAPAVPPEPARVRFAAYPWAQVRLTDDGRSFYTPRAEPVELEPGSHQIVFEHPRFGRVRYTLELGPGEERTVRHVYEEASGP